MRIPLFIKERVFTGTLTASKRHPIIPSATSVLVVKEMVSLLPSRFGEKPASDTWTYNGVGRESILIPRSWKLFALPASSTAER